MIGLPAGTRVWLAAGVTDMRRYVQLTIMLSTRPDVSSVIVFTANYST